MGVTSIEWCDQSINPIRAKRSPPPRNPSDFGREAAGHYCELISPGCANCYASALQSRFQLPRFPGATRDDQTVPLDGTTKTGVRPYFDEKALAAIRKRRKPTRYFVCDMTDPFGWWVPDEWLDAMFATFAQSPQHVFMLLTKRPERMRAFLAHPDQNGRMGWPLDNVWLGVSAEDQKRWNERVQILAQTPAAVRFVSVEPMLGPIDFEFVDGGCVSRYDSPALDSIRLGAGIDWVIFGGESGPGARPCNVEWIRDGLAQCKAAGVPAFVKQLGANATGGSMVDHGDGSEHESIRLLTMKHKKGGDPAEWPDDLRVRDFPQVAR